MSIKHVVSVSGGKDSLATLLIAIQRFGVANIIAIFCDTGNEHELTYQYLDYLEERLGIKIVRLKADFTEQIAHKRKFIARDQRTRREYDTRPVFEADGVTPVPKRDGRGQIVLNKKGKPVQKTVKVGGGRRVRWSNKAKRRALAVLHPTGNVFLDLCLWKGRFPSRKAQFCTEELKRNIAVEFQMDLMDQGHTVVSWQGIRRDESHNRRDAEKFERVAPRLYIFRPIVEWTALEAVAFATLNEIVSNPLYSMGMGRVGCFPCINAGKDELRQMAARFPAHMQRISDWEQLVGMASKRGFSTFFTEGHDAKDRRAVFAELNIWSRIQWAKTTRGGQQYYLLHDAEETNGCASSRTERHQCGGFCMTHCTNCGRALKNATETGMGPVCARRAKAVPVPEHDRDLFGYDIEKAVQAARYQLEVYVAVLVEDAHQAVRRGFRAARERLGL